MASSKWTTTKRCWSRPDRRRPVEGGWQGSILRFRLGPRIKTLRHLPSRPVLGGLLLSCGAARAEAPHERCATKLPVCKASSADGRCGEACGRDALGRSGGKLRRRGGVLEFLESRRLSFQDNIAPEFAGDVRDLLVDDPAGVRVPVLEVTGYEEVGS